MSALADLSGFYQPVGNDVWNPDLSWQPIPVHTVPEKLDEVLAAKKECLVYDYELKKLYKSPEMKAYDKKFKPIYKYLTQHTGKVVDSFQSVQNIFSCLFIEEKNNFTLPEWTKKVYPDQMFEISGLSFAIKTYTKVLARLKMGPLLKEILTHYHNKTKGHLNPNRNLFIYSAHDTTVANMLNTLGVFESLGYHNPPYTATVLFELREISGKHFVQVFYKNSTEPRLLDLPNCGTLCPLEKMFEVYKDVIPGSWEEECRLSILQMPLDVNIGESLSFGTIFGFVFLMFLVSMFVLFIATVYKQRKDYISEEKWNSLNNDWS
jgi:lysosomal acid phosphatase